MNRAESEIQNGANSEPFHGTRAAGESDQVGWRLAERKRSSISKGLIELRANYVAEDVPEAKTRPNQVSSYSRSNDILEYDEGRADFELHYLYEVSRDGLMERTTRPKKTIRTRLRSIGIWVFGFFTGLICNYIAAYLTDRFKFW